MVLIGWIGAGLLSLANIFIEPAKVLFLNNAINHGILTPLGIEQAAETGKSILFLLEANPGPGLQVCWVRTCCSVKVQLNQLQRVLQSFISSVGFMKSISHMS